MLAETFAFPLGLAIVSGIGVWWVGRELSSPRIERLGKRTISVAFAIALFLGLIDTGALSQLFEGIDS